MINASAFVLGNKHVIGTVSQRRRKHLTYWVHEKMMIEWDLGQQIC